MSQEQLTTVEEQFNIALGDFSQNVAPRIPAFPSGGEKIEAIVDGVSWEAYWDVPDPDFVPYKRFWFLKNDGIRPVIYARAQDGSGKLFINDEVSISPDGQVSCSETSWIEESEEEPKRKLIEVIEEGMKAKKRVMNAPTSL